MKIITNITYPLFGLFAFASFALAPQAQAACQGGCLANDNAVLGDDALISLTTGSNNTATGVSALRNNRSGDNNTATGFLALSGNGNGDSNTATGAYALQANTTGRCNAVNGVSALESNTIGDSNTAIGSFALRFNQTGNYNTAVGAAALTSLTTGYSNIAVGTAAGANLGTGSSNIYIGAAGNMGSESNTIHIGTSYVHINGTYIAGIYGSPLASGSSVRIDSSGHLGTVVSSARFKREIRPMEDASEAILALQPVTFRYKQEIDAEGILQFGLVAEEVEKVDPALVERDQEGRPYTVRYDAVNAMLLNEFLKEHRTVQELKKEIAALTATVQKVSAQVELSSNASQTVVDNH